jgi:hypothetical protein
MPLDPETRALIDEAIALDDEARRRCAAWDERQRMMRKSAETEVVYKTTEDARVEPPPLQTQASDWDAWFAVKFRQYIDPVLDDLCDMIGKEIALAQNEDDKRFNIKLSELRADIEIFKAFKLQQKSRTNAG